MSKRYDNEVLPFPHEQHGHHKIGATSVSLEKQIVTPLSQPEQ